MRYFAIIIAILLLITGIADIHVGYGYYQLLRWIVCICSGLITYEFYLSNNKLFILYAIIAVLFNPIAPIYLDKDVWQNIDIITAITFFIYAMKHKNLKNPENRT